MGQPTQRVNFNREQQTVVWKFNCTPGDEYTVFNCMFCCTTSFQSNRTPLYVASHNGHLDVVRILLVHVAVADVNVATSDVSHVMFKEYHFGVTNRYNYDTWTVCCYERK